MTSTTSTTTTPRLEDQLEVTVTSSPAYIDAQRAVDHLSDERFPVEQVSIVGHGLKSVEQVTGRMTKARAALAGAGTGAWFGLLLGLLLGVFVPGVAWFAVMLSALVMATFWGAVIGFVAHWATRGRRDFSSMKALAAQRYDVVVPRPYAEEATRLLATR